MASSSSTSNGVPPGFRFHPTDEELLLYYLKKKVSFEKFDLDVIREVDLNKVEPWDLQERCRIGTAPQSDWYFFSHKDRKYPTGSRTNRATHAGFWKATGRDKCIRTTHCKIGMRKTLVFYRGRAPHGQKTEWIMHEYRLQELDDVAATGTEDGWVVCRVFKKKCFFKAGTSEDTTVQAADNHDMDTAATAAAVHDHHSKLALSSHYNIPHNHHHHLLLLPHHQPSNFYSKPEIGLHSYQQHIPAPAHLYSHVQVQDLLPNHRPADYRFLQTEVDAPEQIDQQGRDRSQSDHWAVLDGIEGRFGNNGSTMNQIPQQQQQQQQQQQRGGEMDLWEYGK